MTDALAWTLAEAAIPARGLDIAHVATAEECREVARQLDLVACDRLALTGHITAEKGERYHFVGALIADVTQTCIISLDPLPAHIEGKINVYFGPASAAGEADEDAENFDPFAEADDEPVENGEIPLGRVAFEELATLLDPYPRKPGLDFDWRDPAIESSPANPFAQLEALKSRKNEG
jgi:hypothetical protein